MTLPASQFTGRGWRLDPQGGLLFQKSPACDWLGKIVWVLGKPRFDHFLGLDIESEGCGWCYLTLKGWVWPQGFTPSSDGAWEQNHDWDLCWKWGTPQPTTRATRLPVSHDGSRPGTAGLSFPQDEPGFCPLTCSLEAYGQASGGV